MLYADSKQRNRKNSQFCYTQSQGNGEDEIWWYNKHSWRQIKAVQAFFNKKDDNFSQMKLGLPLTLVMPGTSAFNIPGFYPFSTTDCNEVPNSQWLSKKFGHLPHICSRLFSMLFPALTNCTQTRRFHLLTGCRLPLCKSPNLCIPLFSHPICEGKILPYY